ncbi:camphor resistance CrcB family protein [Parasponia andersonii]|uniref:Camphor resistance CrcB family protein n=1 Tax=Parasponia andersonii TaxID=3476 RepID=A0A2P5CFM6_PARAD|nr:camphor resistance CrcB family protein [Parasponia andersonii]
MSSQEKSSHVLMVGGYRVTPDSESGRTGSFGRTSSATSSIRRRSFNLSGALPSQIDDNIESETVSEAGDIGDRALHSNRNSRSGSLRFSFDRVSENGVVIPIPDDTLSQPHVFSSRDPAALISLSPVSLLPEELISPLSTDAMVQAESKMQSDEKEMPKLLEYCSCLIHLAVFGILGVLTRYLLQKLFGPGTAGVTSNETLLYLDLPSNMVGSFLMGWFGVVFKGDISRVSDFLAIGLSTGYLGSLTTFSGWNQKMLELSVEGHWVSSVLGFLIGLFLAAYSIIFGVETAKGFRQLLEKKITNQESGIRSSGGIWRVDSRKRHMAVMVVFTLILGLLWSVSAILLRDEFSSDGGEAQLWLGCIVGPPGVWIRWFLARLNGRGLGKAGRLKWIPFGTVIANVSAACIMAALSTTRKEVNTKTCDTITTGIQLGFLGCLSTVSTFIAEFNAMRESKYPWRAYVYAMITICISFGLGTLIYSVPVWTKGYN